MRTASGANLEEKEETMFTQWRPDSWAAWIGGKRFLVFAGAMVLAVGNGYFDGSPVVTVAFLIGGYGVLMFSLVFFLDIGRSRFIYALGLLVFLVTSTIIAFALHYGSSGLLADGRKFVPDFRDAVYFSATTFTTLGYGDFQPLPEHRLTTSIEALLGMTFMATLVSFIWFWVRERQTPTDETFHGRTQEADPLTFFQGTRTRILRGEELDTKKWEDLPEGVRHYYDKDRKDWTAVSDPGALPDDAVTIERKKRGVRVTIPPKRTFLAKILGLGKKPDRKGEP